jgi:oxalate decarboxylase/phosphoglucose isomerase-like protein (cupin superfamily)
MPNIFDTFVVLGPDQSAVPVDVTPTVYQELDRRFDAFKRHLLVSSYRFEGDWPTWEIHPHGDEIVVLLSGAAEFVLDEAGGHRRVRLATAGQYVIVPKATWHTAKIAQPATLLFVTPGEGTQNRSL